MKYHEDYQASLLGFSRAAALDPTWPEPREKEEHLFQYLRKVSDLVNTKVSDIHWFSYFTACILFHNLYSGPLIFHFRVS